VPTEVPRDVLPPAERAFEGKVGTYYSDSVADVPVLPSAPDGAPNVLVVLLNDVGFGHPDFYQASGHGRKFVGGLGAGGGVCEIEAAGGVEGVFG